MAAALPNRLPASQHCQLVGVNLLSTLSLYLGLITMEAIMTLEVTHPPWLGINDPVTLGEREIPVLGRDIVYWFSN